MLPLTFHLVFDLYLFMKVIKCFLRPHAVLANSLQLFMLLAIFFTSRFTFIYTLARHCFHRKNVFFVVPRHDRCKGNGENRFVSNLFKTWRRKDIPRVSSSELFSYREPRKTLLKINLLLLWAIFQSLFVGRLLFCIVYSQVTWCSAHNVKNDVLTFKTELTNVIQKDSFKDIFLNSVLKIFQTSQENICSGVSF